MTPTAVDLCAGPGGWDVAAQALGIYVVGFEIDDAAIRTRDAAGHRTAIAACSPECVELYGKRKHPRVHPRGIRGLSMTEVDPLDWLNTLMGLIASPPCTGFSLAGKGAARRDCAALIEVIYACRTADDVAAAIAQAPEWMSHDGTVLVLEPLRWALTARPAWLAWEQVPPVLPVWHACAHVLRLAGYTVEVAVLRTEQYGVGQTRERAVLVGRSPMMTVTHGAVRLPKPTHSRYYRSDPTRLDPGVPRWLSMRDVLGHGMAADRGRWAQRRDAGPGAERDPRPLDEPSYTIRANGSGSAPSGVEWVSSIDGEPLPEWADRRPATTVVGSYHPEVIAAPGYRTDISRQDAPDSVRVTVAEAGQLQSFAADYPWQGTKSKQHQQVGNAVPPVFAEHVLRAAAVDVHDTDETLF